eukprot:jgi/Mesvir1/7543/Mv19288-RA.1
MHGVHMMIDTASPDENPIVMCEGCPNGVHLLCMDPPLTKVPKGDYFNLPPPQNSVDALYSLTDHLNKESKLTNDNTNQLLQYSCDGTRIHANYELSIATLPVFTTVWRTFFATVTMFMALRMMMHAGYITCIWRRRPRLSWPIIDVHFITLRCSAPHELTNVLYGRSLMTTFSAPTTSRLLPDVTVDPTHPAGTALNHSDDGLFYYSGYGRAAEGRIPLPGWHKRPRSTLQLDSWQGRRILSEDPWDNIRIQAVLEDNALSTLWSQSLLTRLRDEVVPLATSHLARLVGVRQPWQGSLRLPRSCERWAVVETLNTYMPDQNKCLQLSAGTCQVGTFPARYMEGGEDCSGEGGLLVGGTLHFSPGTLSCQLIEGGPGAEDADLLLLVTAKGSPACDSGQVAAHGKSCWRDPLTDRPIGASINVCAGHASWQAGTSDGATRIQVNVILQEVMRILGLSPSLFPYWRNTTGAPRVIRDSLGQPPAATLEPISPAVANGALGNVLSASLRPGSSLPVYKLVTPMAVAAARENMGCPTLDGVEMDTLPRYEGDTQVPGHLASRLYTSDVLGAAVSSDQVLSRISLSSLADTGWYEVDASAAPPLQFAWHAGCDIISARCTSLTNGSSTPAMRDAYCTPTTEAALQQARLMPRDNKCTFNKAAVGVCRSCLQARAINSSSTTANCVAGTGCGIVQEEPSLRCKNGSLAFLGNGDASELIYWGQRFGPGSSCFEDGSVDWVKGKQSLPSQGAGCYRRQCVRSNDVLDDQGRPTWQLQVRVGDSSPWQACPTGSLANVATGGEFSVATIGPCPDNQRFCLFNACPDDCNGNGECFNETCYCLPGFAGPSCSQRLCTPASCRAGYACSPDTGACERVDDDDDGGGSTSSPSSSGTACLTIWSMVGMSAPTSRALFLESGQWTQFLELFRGALRGAALGVGSARVSDASVAVHHVRSSTRAAEVSTLTQMCIQGQTSAALERAATEFQTRIRDRPASLFQGTPLAWVRVDESSAGLVVVNTVTPHVPSSGTPACTPSGGGTSTGSGGEVDSCHLLGGLSTGAAIAILLASGVIFGAALVLLIGLGRAAHHSRWSSGSSSGLALTSSSRKRRGSRGSRGEAAAAAKELYRFPAEGVPADPPPDHRLVLVDPAGGELAQAASRVSRRSDSRGSGGDSRKSSWEERGGGPGSSVSRTSSALLPLPSMGSGGDPAEAPGPALSRANIAVLQQSASMGSGGGGVPRHCPARTARC